MLYIENLCQWPSCSKSFQTIEDLIQHVEEVHVLKDLEVEATPTINATPLLNHNSSPSLRDNSALQPTVHLSHVNRYFSDEQLEKRRKFQQLQQHQLSTLSMQSDVLLDEADLHKEEFVDSGIGSPEPLMLMDCVDSSDSLPNDITLTVTSPYEGGEEEEDDDDDNSNNKINSGLSNKKETTTKKSSLTDMAEILGKTARETLVMGKGETKAYVCPVPGCGKRYKNANGIKYHAIHGHGTESMSKRPYKCDVLGCGRRYKSSNGLKQHLIGAHGSENPEITADNIDDGSNIVLEEALAV